MDKECKNSICYTMPGHHQYPTNSFIGPTISDCVASHRMASGGLARRCRTLFQTQSSLARKHRNTQTVIFQLSDIVSRWDYCGVNRVSNNWQKAGQIKKTDMQTTSYKKLC